MMRPKSWLVLVSLFLMAVAGGMEPGFGAAKALVKKRVARPLEGAPELIIKYLVTTHPRREIRDYFDSLIESGTVIVAFTEGAVGGSGGDATLFVGREAETPEMLKPFLTFSEQALRDATASDDYWYGVVLHFSQHLRQLAAGRVPPALFLPYPKGTTFGREATRLFFSSKIEAFLAECTFALEVGSWHETSVCTSYKEGGIRAMYREIAGNYGGLEHFLLVKDYLFELAEEFAREAKNRKIVETGIKPK